MEQLRIWDANCSQMLLLDPLKEDYAMDEMINDLKAVGLKPIIIDENFDFDTLPPLDVLLGMKPEKEDK